MKIKRLLFLCAFLAASFLTGTYAQSKADSLGAAGIVSAKAKKANCAIFYIYRPKSRKISFASFTININDSAVCKIKSNNRYIVKIYKTGPTEIWARSEKRSSVTLNVETGKAYYLKCHVKKGFAGEIPDLQLIDPEKGAEEFDEAEDGD